MSVLYIKGVAQSWVCKALALFCLFLFMVASTAGLHVQPRQRDCSSETVEQQSLISQTTTDRTVTIDDQQIVIPDLRLKDQDGRNVRFYTDLLKDKTFVLGFFFTSCTYTCVKQASLFAALQRELGKRLGRDVFIVSVTMDPQTDTVARLKAWSAKYGRRRGWTLVTGPVAEMNKLLIAFSGQKAGPKEIHSGQIFIVNDRTGQWTHVDELTTATEVEKRIDELGP